MVTNTLGSALSGVSGNVLQASNGEDFVGIAILVVYVGIILLYIAGMWTVYSKANKPGWGALIPIYNIYLLFKINGRSGWWLASILIPPVFLLFYWFEHYELAKSFGRGIGYGLGLLFLPFLFYPLLGLGSHEYQGPAAG